MRAPLVVAALLLGLAAAAAATSTVLDSDAFAAVLKSDDLWLIEFHDGKESADFGKAAAALKGVVKCGNVDISKVKTSGLTKGVKLYSADKAKPIAHSGKKTTEGYVEAALAEIQAVVNTRIGKKPSSSSSDDSKKAGSDGEVIELTESNFEKLVLQSNDLWLVEFFAPWCGHCKSLAPQYKKAASELGSRARLGAVDATVHASLASRYDIRGYPTIKYFAPGAKRPGGEEYDGGRQASDIVAWVEAKLESSMPPPEVVELTGQEAFDTCVGRQVCFVTVLSHIGDSSAKEREASIKTIKTLSERFRSRPFGWVWAEAGAQPELESAIGVGGFGYPAVAAINAKKKRFSLLHGAFTEQAVASFVNNLLAAKQVTQPLNDLPAIKSIEGWDGKDFVPPVEEEIDLKDLFKDEDLPKKKTEL